MQLQGKKVGFVMTGAFCTFKKAIEQLRIIIEEKADVLPIMSFNAYNLDTKFGKAEEFVAKIEKITR